MEAVDAFNTELLALYDMKPPISKAKMMALTKGALKANKFYKHVVQSVEKFIQRCKPEYKVPGLYVIDAIVRQSRHQFGDRDVFASRFAKNIMVTFVHLFKCSVDEKSKIIRVLNLWQRHNVFSADVIQPLIDLANADHPFHKEVESRQTTKSTQKEKPPRPGGENKQPGISIRRDLYGSAENGGGGGVQDMDMEMEMDRESEPPLLDKTPSQVVPGLNENMNGNLVEQLQTLHQFLMKQSDPGQGGTPRKKTPQHGDDQAVAFNRNLLDFDYESDEEEQRTRQQQQLQHQHQQQQLLQHQHQHQHQDQRHHQSHDNRHHHQRRGSTSAEPSPATGGQPPSSSTAGEGGSSLDQTLGQILSNPDLLKHLQGLTQQNAPPSMESPGSGPHQFGGDKEGHAMFIASQPPPPLGPDFPRGFSFNIPPPQHPPPGNIQPPPLPSGPPPPPPENDDVVVILENENSRRDRRRTPSRDRDRRGGRRGVRRRSRSRSRSRSGSRGRGRVGRRVRGRRSRSRSRSKSRSRDRDRPGRRGARGAKRSGSKDGDDEKLEERERERRKKGLPPIRKNCLSICSTTLWIGHLSKLVHEAELSDVFGTYGEILSIDLIPPRGCAFVCMSRRQDAHRAMQKLQDEAIGGKAITIAWAAGKGVKDRELKDFWEGDMGVSYIPYDKLPASMTLARLEQGGTVDEETIPDHLKEQLMRQPEPDQPDVQAIAAANGIQVVPGVGNVAGIPTPVGGAPGMITTSVMQIPIPSASIGGPVQPPMGPHSNQEAPPLPPPPPPPVTATEMVPAPPMGMPNMTMQGLALPPGMFPPHSAAAVAANMAAAMNAFGQAHMQLGLRPGGPIPGPMMGPNLLQNMLGPPQMGQMGQMGPMGQMGQMNQMGQMGQMGMRPQGPPGGLLPPPGQPGPFLGFMPAGMGPMAGGQGGGLLPTPPMPGNQEPFMPMGVGGPPDGGLPPSGPQVPDHGPWNPQGPPETTNNDDDDGEQLWERARSRDRDNAQEGEGAPPAPEEEEESQYYERDRNRDSRREDERRRDRSREREGWRGGRDRSRDRGRRDRSRERGGGSGARGRDTRDRSEGGRAGERDRWRRERRSRFDSPDEKRTRVNNTMPVQNIQPGKASPENWNKCSRPETMVTPRRGLLGHAPSDMFSGPEPEKEAGAEPVFNEPGPPEGMEVPEGAGPGPMMGEGPMPPWGPPMEPMGPGFGPPRFPGPDGPPLAQGGFGGNNFVGPPGPGPRFGDFRGRGRGGGGFRGRGMRGGPWGGPGFDGPRPLMSLDPEGQMFDRRGRGRGGGPGRGNRGGWDDSRDRRGRDDRRDRGRRRGSTPEFEFRSWAPPTADDFMERKDEDREDRRGSSRDDRRGSSRDDRRGSSRDDRRRSPKEDDNRRGSPRRDRRGSPREDRPPRDEEGREGGDQQPHSPPPVQNEAPPMETEAPLMSQEAPPPEEVQRDVRMEEPSFAPENGSNDASGPTEASE